MADPAGPSRDRTLLQRLGQSLRRIEILFAVACAVLIWIGALLGFFAPYAGGPEPGFGGRVGFTLETAAALWLPCGFAAGVLLLVALLRRLWRTALAVVPIVLLILLPELWSRAITAPPLAASARTTLRIAAVNLWEDNEDDPLMEASLRALDADVLVLPECTPWWQARLARWFTGDYPHRLLATPPERPGYSTKGLQVAVWSRVPPAGEAEVILLGGFNPQIRVPLRWNGRELALYGIHLRRPWPSRSYAGALHDRREILARLRAEPLPVVLAGDFNAVPRSSVVQRLRDLGLTLSSEAVLGHAPGTWPMRPDWVAPLRIAIDHVLHGPEFRAVGFRHAAPTRSDHGGVLAELVWRDP